MFQVIKNQNYNLTAWKRESFFVFWKSFLADKGLARLSKVRVKVKRIERHLVWLLTIYSCCDNLQVTVSIWPACDEDLAHRLPPLLLPHLHLGLAKMEGEVYFRPRLPCLPPGLLCGGILHVCQRPTLLGRTRRRRKSCNNLSCISIAPSTKLQYSGGTFTRLFCSKGTSSIATNR